MAEYTVLIIGDADRWWTSMTMQERKDGYAAYGRFNQALAEGGHKIVGGAELTRTSDLTGELVRDLLVVAGASVLALALGAATLQRQSA